MSSDVFDELYYLENNKLTFKTAVDFLKSLNFNENIDMKSHQIKKCSRWCWKWYCEYQTVEWIWKGSCTIFQKRNATKIDPLNKKITELTTKVYTVERQLAKVALHDEVMKRIFELYFTDSVQNIWDNKW